MWFRIAMALLVLVVSRGSMTHGAEPSRPNIVFILADDLGYGDLGCYGQKLIQTPHLDRMAAEGVRFTQFYAGATVCAPSRSVLMTGQHGGHTHVRGNAGAKMEIQALRNEDITVAEALHDAGYETALCGKWGLGDELPETLSGHPLNQGFDFFFGYLNQTHAHNYYPEFLWRNRERVPLRNKVVATGTGPFSFHPGYATERRDYSHDLVMQQAVSFLEQPHDKPFYLYLALTIPHANNEGTRGTSNGQEVPDFGPYADRDWSDQNKGQAAMITRMDRDIGRLFELLKKLKLDERTVVLFSSDNGPHNEGGHTPNLFHPGGPLRGMKRDLYEGGIRVPMIVRWPGVIPPGHVSDHIGYFGDFFATACEWSEAKLPANIDSLSFAKAVRGDASQPAHDYLYWEFYERGSAQAVRQGQWKAVRKPMLTGRTELFDLTADIGETTDIAAARPELVRKLETLMNDAHQPHPNWQLPADAATKKPSGAGKKSAN